MCGAEEEGNNSILSRSIERGSKPLHSPGTRDEQSGRVDRGPGVIEGKQMDDDERQKNPSTIEKKGGQSEILTMRLECEF